MISSHRMLQGFIVTFAALLSFSSFFSSSATTCAPLPTMKTAASFLRASGRCNRLVLFLEVWMVDQFSESLLSSAGRACAS